MVQDVSMEKTVISKALTNQESYILENKMLNSKRSRLIEVARKLIYRQGFNMTTLADIATGARVPLGNIYYYFRTKADIGIAVLNLIATEQQILLENLDKEPSAKARLHYFLEYLRQDGKLIALQGCHIGTLCQEFAKERGSALHKLAAKTMMDLLLWIEAQFHALGFVEEASDLSLELTYKLQGVFLLGHAFKDSSLIVRQIILLQETIKEQTTKVNAFEESV